MRLITHNMLMCNVKKCTGNNFPLRIENAELETCEAEFNEDFIKRISVKVDWPALSQTAFALGVDQLPTELPADLDDMELRRLHKVLLEVEVKSGRMVCPNCGHIFPIKDGIPNMLLQENEV
ncbi:hypothetical protein HDU96_002503 [Phlyctochytrium bullatum]|nr:hypothetical protein HDU96_002503 [Phlyctochytrium bullatum]